MVPTHSIAEPSFSSAHTVGVGSGCRPRSGRSAACSHPILWLRSGFNSLPSRPSDQQPPGCSDRRALQGNLRATGVVLTGGAGPSTRSDCHDCVHCLSAAVTLVATLLLMTAVWLMLRAIVASTTVYEYERALRFVRGRLRGDLGAGRYWHLRRSTVVQKIDMRPILLPVNGQEVLSRDGVAVKASLSATYRVTDPTTAVLAADSYATAFYSELQQALRVTIAGADVESLLAGRAELGPRILRDVQPAAVRLGLEVERVAIRDLTLPGELKKIFAQVVRARQEGLAALERARGETAALRNLANAAQLMERSPTLLQLRMLQVAEQHPALTMVVGVPPAQTAASLPPATAPRERPPANP